MNKASVALIKNLLKDMSSNNDELRLDGARKFITTPYLCSILIEAGCPKNILDAMRDTIELSYVERVYCCKKILAEVKKIPALGED